jgi:RHS repeat-associated protein
MLFYPFVFTGKERDEETGYGYFGARYMDHSLLTSFISVDRYASKYPFISPYVYCTWNPIRLIDPTGDTIVIMGGNDTKVYYSPGMKYSGSDGFVKQTVSALNTLNGTDEGSKIISGLHISNNTFSIHEAESGGNKFVPSDRKRAIATQLETDPMLKQQYEIYRNHTRAVRIDPVPGKTLGRDL